MPLLNPGFCPNMRSHVQVKPWMARYRNRTPEKSFVEQYFVSHGCQVDIGTENGTRQLTDRGVNQDVQKV